MTPKDEIAALKAEVARMQPVFLAGMALYRSIKPVTWSNAQQDANSACNATNKWLEQLARACAKASRNKID